MIFQLPYLSCRSRATGAGTVLAVSLGLLLLLLLPPTLPASADVPIADDDFEDSESGETGFGWLDDWEFDDDAGFSNSGPHEGSGHIRVRPGGSATRSIDVTGEGGLVLSFWARAEELEDDLLARVEVSGDGESFTELHRWEDEDDESYSLFEFDLASTGLSFANGLWVRARISGDDDDDSDGELVIDELLVTNSEVEPEPVPESNTDPVQVDGDFGDWEGKASLPDPFGDQSGPVKRDIAALYWANNIDESINFHMIERHTKDGLPFDGSNGQSAAIRYILHIDTNDNGDYSESEDRRAVITYAPSRNRSNVNVRVYPGDSFHQVSNSGWHDWGESRNEGGLRVEFPLDWQDLDIQFGGVIRMYAESFAGLAIFPIVGDRVPDGNADIQWSPASVLGKWVLGALTGGGLVAVWLLARRRRLWT